MNFHTDFLNHPVFPKNYDFPLVMLSIFIAVLASFSSFGIVERYKSVNSLNQKIFWNFFGALSMGLGIWVMHFAGMIALKLPVPVQYNLLLTVSSIAPALIVSSFVLWLLTIEKINLVNLKFYALLFVLGICSMHYTGMAAMQLNATKFYDPVCLLLSLIAAFLLAYFALRINTTYVFWSDNFFKQQIISATVMGSAISGIHYLSMSSVNFINNQKFEVDRMGIDPDNLLSIVFAVACGLVLSAIVLPLLLKYYQLCTIN